MSKRQLKKVLIILAALTVSMSLFGCPSSKPIPPRIDLEQVNEAFLTARGATSSSWLWDFERMANEIYFGTGMVSVQVRRIAGRVYIYGFVNKNKLYGYQPLRDRLLFKIVQTSSILGNAFTYRVEDHNGWVYKSYTRRRSAYASFFAYMLMPSFYVYYTPRTRYILIRKRRRLYRKSARFRKRRARFARYRKSTRSRRRSHRSRSRRSRRGRRGGKW